MVKVKTKKNKTKTEVIKKKSVELENNEEEPGFKEYAIIFLAIFLFIGGIYYFFEIFYPTESEKYLIDQTYRDAGITDQGFKYDYYPYEGKKVVIDFVYELSSLEQFTFKQELTKNWLLSHDELVVLTPPVLQNISENGLLIKTNGKFASFLLHAIGANIELGSFKTIGEGGISCENATEELGVITYNYTAGFQGVVIDDSNPNCIYINSNENSVDFVQAIDKIMYDLVIVNNN